MDWRHQAACRDIDPEIFFPIGTTGPALAQIKAAQAICGTCAVSTQCLEWALDTGQDAGIWGGLTEEERRAVRRGSREPVAV
ncbi:MAG TPA: WhiB family transcriptional regulator [Actinomycetota bacterium]